MTQITKMACKLAEDKKLLSLRGALMPIDIIMKEGALLGSVLLLLLSFSLICSAVEPLYARAPEVKIEELDTWAVRGVEDESKLPEGVRVRYAELWGSFYDVSVYVLYHQIRTSLAQKEAAKLDQEQREWLARLIKEGDARYDEGQDLRAIETKMLSMRKERVAELEARLPERVDVLEARGEVATLRAWWPDIDVGELKDFVQGEGLGDTRNLPQQILNLYSGNLAALWEARVYIAYTRLAERLDTRAAAKLRREQATWIRNTKQAARDIFNEAMGGTIGPYEQSMTIRAAARERYFVLTARLIELDALKKM